MRLIALKSIIMLITRVLVLLTTVFCSELLLAQNGTWSKVANPKKSNKIGVLLKDTSLNTCRSKVIVQMTLHGYNVAINDLNGFNITSSPKKLNITEITINASGTKTDSGYFVIFTPKGEIKTKSEITNGPLDIYNSNLKGSLSHNAWEDIKLLCLDLNGKIYYYNRK
jgi:hypothetical protein